MYKNLLEYLEITADRIPDAAAYIDEKQSVCFRELLDNIESIGSFLLEEIGIQKRPVAVLARRSVSSIEGLFGALKSGTCYVPIDPKMPSARMDSVLEQLGPAAVLYTEEDKATAEKLSSRYRTVSIEEAMKAPVHKELLTKAGETVLDTDPAYIIFTSGSTGTPKGILVSHRSVIDFIEWYSDITGITDEDRLGNQAPFFFDLSVKDLYMTLKTGAATVVIPQKCFSFPLLLIDELNKHQITTLSWATSAFHLVAASGILEKKAPEYLKRVLAGGEAMQAKLLNRWRKALPDVSYVNLYGPTEVTVDCTWHPIDREYDDSEQIPIGKACANMDVLLLKDDGSRAEQGETGEICVRGAGLAIGYWNDKEKTEKAFVQNPLNKEYPDRMYRTGDYGKMNSSGEIVFSARSDEQIKHMGYRIELQEIESVIYRIDDISSAVCMHNKTEDKLICVYEGDIETTDLAKKLRPMLPKYMMPNRFFRRERMMYNANGKVDRPGLKKEYLN